MSRVHCRLMEEVSSSGLALELLDAALGLGAAVGLLVPGGPLALPARRLVGDREAFKLGQRQRSLRLGEAILQPIYAVLNHLRAQPEDEA